MFSPKHKTQQLNSNQVDLKIEVYDSTKIRDTVRLYQRKNPIRADIQDIQAGGTSIEDNTAKSQKSKFGSDGND